MANDDSKYWAFISYSHQDKKWGDWLHKGLETYRVPKRLVGREGRDGEIRSRIMPVFRDREELPTSSDLGSTINDALARSRVLIVICSPRSAQSHWVNEEIITYKKLGRADHILCLIVDGEPNATDKRDITDEPECFPPALRFELDNDGQLTDQRCEPIAADARTDGDGKRDALLKLVAGLLGVGFDDLKQRDVQRRQKRLIAITSASLVAVALAAALAVFAFISRNDAVVARDEAYTERQRAEVSDRNSRRMVSHAFGDLGWRRIDNNDQAGAMLLHVESLKRIIETPLPIAEDAYVAQMAALRVAGHLRWSGKCEAVCSANGVIQAIHESDGRVLAAVVSATVDMEAPSRVYIYDVLAGKRIGESNQVFRGYAQEAAFNPAGDRFAVAGDQVTIWDTATCALLYKHDAVVPSRLVFTPDGKRLIVGTTKRCFALNIDTKKEVWSSTDIDWVNRLDLSPDGKHVLVSNGSNKAILLATADGTAASPILSPGEVLKPVSSLSSSGVVAASFSADSLRLFTTSASGQLNVWSVPDGKPLMTPIENGQGTLAAAMDPAGRVILASRGNQMTAWEVGNILAQPRKINIPSTIHSLTYFNDGASIAVTSYDETHVIDAVHLTGRALAPASFGIMSKVTPLKGDRFAIHIGNEIHVWNFNGARAAWTIIDDQAKRPAAPVPTNPRGEMSIHRTAYTRPIERWPLRVAWVPSGDHLYVVGTDGKMVTWSRKGANKVWAKGTVVDSKIGKLPIAFDMLPDGRLFIGSPTLQVVTTPQAQVDARPMPAEHEVSRLRTGGDRLLMVGNDLWLRDLNTNKPIADSMFKPSSQWKDAIDGWLSADGEFLLTAHHKMFLSTSDPLTLTGWNARTGKQLWQSTSSGSLAYASITLAPDGKSFAMAIGGHVMVHNAADGKQRGEKVRLNSSGLRYSPDSKSIAALTLDGVAVIDAQSGEQILPAFNRGAERVIDAAFDLSGGLLVTTTMYEATVWDARNGKRLTIGLRPGYAERVSISPNGRSIISLSPRSVLWDLWDPDLLPADIPSLRKIIAQLQARAELQANRRINDAGAEVRLTAEQRRKRWETMTRTEAD